MSVGIVSPCQDILPMKAVETKIFSVWRVAFFLVLAWTFFMALAYFYQRGQRQEETIKNGLIQARIAFAKDLIYRQWNAEQGGVYVEVTPQTPPNPYLRVPERDITTPSGRSLTLINPAYMTRMVHELEEKNNGTLGHITSLRPINPANAPDEWEKQALRTFTKADDLFFSLAEMNGEEYLRYMRPFIVAPACLKCHGNQGY